MESKGSFKKSDFDFVFELISDFSYFCYTQPSGQLRLEFQVQIFQLRRQFLHNLKLIAPLLALRRLGQRWFFPLYLDREI